MHAPNIRVLAIAAYGFVVLSFFNNCAGDSVSFGYINESSVEDFSQSDAVINQIRDRDFANSSDELENPITVKDIAGDKDITFEYLSANYPCTVDGKPGFMVCHVPSDQTICVTKYDPVRGISHASDTHVKELTNTTGTSLVVDYLGPCRTALLDLSGR